MSVHLTDVGICTRAELDGSHILEAEYFTVWQRADDHVLIVLLELVAAAILEHILERIVRLGAERTRCGLEVLFVEHLRYIRRNKSVLCHLVGIEPYSQRVVRTHDIHLTDAGDTRQTGLDVDLEVVVQEALVERVVGAVKCQCLDVTRLTLAHVDTASRNLGGHKTLSRSDTVLDVHRSHIWVGTLTEVDGDTRRSGIGGRRGHVHHVLYTVQCLLEGYNHTLQDGLGIGSGVGCRYADGRGCDFGELFHWELRQTDESQNQYDNGYYSGQYRSIDK